MPEDKSTLKQELNMSEHDTVECDKGPILQKIVIAVDDLQKHAEKSQETQEKISDALVTIAAQNERIINIADKTQRNEQDIQNLFKLNRETEKSLSHHIQSPRHTPSGQPDLNDATKAKASKFDKIEVAVITAAIMGALGFIWKFIQTVMAFMTNHGGTPS